ncbi:hypothetical protein FACS189449_01120 [Alphaproteobacteria bacterium]|nr:hypothetical protein FACS189449_01120 [Alphaproteobacteria bacterium]
MTKKEDAFVDEAFRVIKDVMENPVDLVVKLNVIVEGGDSSRRGPLAI